MGCNRCRNYWDQDDDHRGRNNDYRRDRYDESDLGDRYEHRRRPRPYREDRRYSPRPNFYGFPRIY
jgi:hypothetical protein